MIKHFIGDRRGATSIEYAMIAFVISIAVITGVTQIGAKLNSKYFAPVGAGLN